MVTEYGLFRVKSFVATESTTGTPFIVLGPKDSSDGKGNFASMKLYFEPEDALAVGQALILHAHRCGATDPKTKEPSQRSEP